MLNPVRVDPDVDDVAKVPEGIFESTPFPPIPDPKLELELELEDVEAKVKPSTVERVDGIFANVGKSGIRL